ncbi:hypothetical protein HPB47_008452 [Ixodes persulcatus]|uniref:Uncharacterized protein n=1 Tax=Ixodes persulcatus TaxID=34615 RepID=A0AC60P4P3_IXOPE|nr:hypothetical protein HPB47_008452 [Ixodes persulcatus]
MKVKANVRAIFHLAMELGRREKNPLQVSVKWVPGHMGVAGNKANHRVAVKELSCSDPRRSNGPGGSASLAADECEAHIAPSHSYDPVGAAEAVAKKAARPKPDEAGEPPEELIPLEGQRIPPTPDRRAAKAACRSGNYTNPSQEMRRP